jgi:peroxiredoxin
MAQAFPPTPDQPDEPKEAGRHVQYSEGLSPDARPRGLWRRVLPRLGVLAVTLTALLGVFALVQAHPTTTPVGSVSSAPGTVASGASTTSSAPEAPDFTVTTLDGLPFHLASQQGHVVVLYFMATGCAGCEPGSHDLAQALLSAKTPGAEALAIDLNSGDRPADLGAFVQSLGIPATTPVAWGIDTTGAIASAYQVQVLETTVVINQQGQIAYRNDGPVSPDQLAQIVRNLA